LFSASAQLPLLLFLPTLPHHKSPIQLFIEIIIMADIFSSHPYPGRKNIMPSKHHCELCDKTFAYKDRAAHDRSKKHKAAMDKQQAALDKKDAFATAKAGGYKGTEAEHNAKYDADHADPNACHNCGQCEYH
jgi:hypothetical protein